MDVSDEVPGLGRQLPTTLDGDKAWGFWQVNSATLARLDIGDRICEREEIASRQGGEGRDVHVGLSQRMLVFRPLPDVPALCHRDAGLRLWQCYSTVETVVTRSPSTYDLQTCACCVDLN